MNSKRDAAALLRALADCVERAAESDVELLLAGKARLRVERTEGEGKQFYKPKRAIFGKKELSKRDWSGIVEQLRSFSSREEGERLVDKLDLSRSEFEQLARTMNLPVSKEDNSDKLKLKIVESSIGTKLVSQAIRGAE